MPAKAKKTHKRAGDDGRIATSKPGRRPLHEIDVKDGMTCVFEGCEEPGRRVELPAGEFLVLFTSNPKAKKAKKVVLCVCDKHKDTMVDVLRKGARHARRIDEESKLGYA